MSGFSHVDHSPNVERLVAYLEATDIGLGAMKSYIAAAANRAVPGGLVIDIGSGVGHDLARLAVAGMSAVGVETSAAMLATARSNLGPAAILMRCDGARLAFRDGVVDGCRIERVLQHVESPDAVLSEVGRVVRPGGFLAVFEPDYSTFAAASDEPGALVCRGRWSPSVIRESGASWSTWSRRMASRWTTSSPNHRVGAISIGCRSTSCR